MKGVIFISLFVLLIMSSCEKWDLERKPNVERKPDVETTDPTEITAISATSGGKITTYSNDHVVARGVCWSKGVSPTIGNDTLVNGSGTGSFIIKLSNLSTNTQYYLRAFAITAKGVYYGNEVSFTTLTETATLPSVNTSAISSITQTTALGGGTVLFSGGFNVSTRGICWSINPNPTLSGSFSIDGNGMGTFSSILYGLIPNTLYYVRSYATNATGTAYGNQVTFTTQGQTVAPVVTTAAVSNITPTSAVGGGNVIASGGAVITTRGICWSIHQNPTNADNITSDGSGTGTYTSQVNGLLPATHYFLRAYASNLAGTGYGNEISFSTPSGSIYTIGQAYGGGIIFYIDSSGQHGLISALSDQLSGVRWGCYGTNINGCSATNIGAGLNNTQNIANNCTDSDIAAKICYDLQLNGYDDWYLPSKDELNLLFLNSNIIGNFQYSFYWSSSENSAVEAWEQNFFSGLQLTYGKYDPISVRAIRTF